MSTGPSSTATPRFLGPGGRLATTAHRPALLVFAVIVVAHWAEHLVQALQIYALGWPVAEARGVLGMPFPWLVSSEWMHYGYALVMVVGLWVLRHGFQGPSRSWWNASLGLQVWHHLEHLLLLLQAITGAYLLGAAKPTSIVQLLVPRVELHLFYNTVVTIPMIIAMVRHMRPRSTDPVAVCACAAPRPLIAA